VIASQVLIPLVLGLELLEWFAQEYSPMQAALHLGAGIEVAGTSVPQQA
jgi:hypothetical protein